MSTILTGLDGANPLGFLAAVGLLRWVTATGERTARLGWVHRGAYRAVIEGISFGLADSLALMRALDPPVPVSAIRLSGGGAKSALWRQVLADVFDTAGVWRRMLSV